ncbi:ribonuclease HII [Candidatus Pacearchaeota archaeon]|nr:ribonuclease HII [Candidatus Pacearchaeota archaeon]
MLLLGIDDAGRGPIIGPMFLAGVLLRPEQEKELKAEGVADSKMLLHPKRIRLAGMIKDVCLKYKLASATPKEIDHSINSRVNLNTLEAIKAAEIINSLLVGIKEKVRIIVDCPSVNTSAWRITLLNYLKQTEDIELLCEHKADVNHPVVSAASILAKVEREEAISKLKAEYGSIGSGYPSDPATQAFLKKQGKKLEKSGIIRTSWATWKALFPVAGQSKLEGFS